jgi:hypothetical protein
MSAIFILMICACPTTQVSRQNLPKNMSYFYTHPVYLLSVLIASAVFRNVEKFGYFEHNSFILTFILLTWRKWWAPNNASK